MVKLLKPVGTQLWKKYRSYSNGVRPYVGDVVYYNKAVWLVRAKDKIRGSSKLELGFISLDEPEKIEYVHADNIVYVAHARYFVDDVTDYITWRSIFISQAAANFIKIINDKSAINREISTNKLLLNEYKDVKELYRLDARRNRYQVCRAKAAINIIWSGKYTWQDFMIPNNI